MKRMAKVFMMSVLIGSALVLLVMVFMPKVAIWYELEDTLLAQKIVIHGETLHDTGLSLQIEDAELYFGSIHAARINMMSVKALGIYNTISMDRFLVGSELKILEGLQIEHAQLSYIPFMDAIVSAEGNFGVLKGRWNLAQRTLTLDVHASTWLKKQALLMRKLQAKGKGYQFVWHY